MNPIIIVGIGGTGNAVIYNLFKRGLPFNVRVVMYDSDLKVKDNAEGFPENLFCATTQTRENATAFCRECLNEKKFKKFAPKFREYWPGYMIGIEDKCAGLGDFSCEGLGQSRPKGFLGLLKNLLTADSIVNKICSLYDDLLTTGKNTGEINMTAGPDIYIIGSFAGGTGSGIFIDLALLLRSKFFSQTPARIYGIFVLGRAAMLGRTSPDHISHDWACANSYAALWELRSWMTSGKPFEKAYSENIEIKNFKEKPYNAVILIDKDNEAGKNLDTYKSYENLVADFIYDLLLRDVSAKRMSTVLDNIMGREGFVLGSAGRGVILYPKRDILHYLNSKVLCNYLSNEAIKEPGSELEKALTNDKSTKFTFLESYLHEIKDIELERLGETIKFPKRPFIETKLNLMNRENYKKMITEITTDIEKFEHEIKNFLQVAMPKYTQKWKDIIFNHFKGEIQSKNIAFLHGYLSRFLEGLLNPKINNLENILKNLNSAKNNQFTEMNTYIYLLKESKGNPQIKKILLEKATEYFNIAEEAHINQYALSFFIEIENYIHIIKDAVNFVQDFMKKELLFSLRNEITNYECGYSTLYPFEAAQIKVLELKTNLDYFDDIYKTVVPETTKLTENKNTKDKIQALEDELAKIIFDDVFPLISVKKTIRWEDQKRIFETITNRLFASFKEVFNNEIPDNIFEALFIEAENKQISPKDYKDYLTTIITNAQKHIAQPFLTEENPDATRTQSVLCIVANLGKLLEAINKYKTELGDSFANVIRKTNQGIKATLIPNNETVDTNEFDDKIIVVNAKFGYNWDYLSQFTEESGLYYAAYKKVINNSDPERRYEVFIDLRNSPQCLPATLLFLLCEYASVIEKVMDKKENETGVYKFENDVLKKGLRGRGNIISWFVNNEDPEKRRRILEEFQKNWNRIEPAERKAYFENVKNALIEAKRKTRDENLKEIYQSNIQVMEQAIQAGYYDTGNLKDII